ncbi:MAG: acyl-CoA desaturase [Burkholderiales bacterium]
MTSITRTTPTTARKPGRWASMLSWFDNERAVLAGGDTHTKGIDWPRLLPFVALHLGCLGVLWVGVSMTAVAAAVMLYAVRMFAITGFYHRYFSHCAFRTTRTAQFIFALLGATGVQRGALWWASQHRHHHTHSDQPEDAHSAHQHGFFWSHMGWFMARENFATRRELVDSLSQYPELRFLDRYDGLVPIAYGLSLYGVGEVLAVWAPALHTNGWQLVVWGFCLSTVVLYHATFTINSLAHRYGSRRYATSDDSRNNVWLALLTFGEGWHNNHHHFPGAARQGFYWWEIDLTYYGLRALAALGIIWDLREVPATMRDARRTKACPL